MATRRFENGTDALNWFKESLQNRGFEIISTEKVRTKAGAGRYVYPVKIETSTKEIYIVKFWNNKWVPSDKISDFAKDLDERYRFTINNFGNNDPSATSMNSDLLLQLLELNDQGYETYIVTIYSSGEVLFCSAQEMHNFTTSYGTLQQYTNDPSLRDALSCRVPTGWLHNWQDPIIAPPCLEQHIGE